MGDGHSASGAVLLVILVTDSSVSAPTVGPLGGLVDHSRVTPDSTRIALCLSRLYAVHCGHRIALFLNGRLAPTREQLNGGLKGTARAGRRARQAALSVGDGDARVRRCDDELHGPTW